MTKIKEENKRLNQLLATRRRLIESYKSCLTTRNTIIDKFDLEFNRHVKLICKKQNYKELPVEHDLRLAVKDSLKRSRNMKKIQTEMDEIVERLKISQIECKNIKQEIIQEIKKIAK
jgi:hypothetical protein